MVEQSPDREEKTTRCRNAFGGRSRIASQTGKREEKIDQCTFFFFIFIINKTQE